MLARESQGSGIALSAETGLETARRVVDAGMDDPAVTSGLVGGQARFFFQHPDRATRIIFKKLHCRGKPDDATADDHDVGVHIHLANSPIIRKCRAAASV